MENQLISFNHRKVIKKYIIKIAKGSVIFMTKNQGYGVCKEEENNMKKKFLVMALAMIMVVSLIAVPTSAEGEVTLLESWFVNTATSAKVYDTLAEATVKPAFYVNNETGAAIEGAKLVLASYDASGKLASVNYTAAPTIAMGESKVEAEESIDVSAGGETYMMIWDSSYAPVVDKVELTTDSRQAEITSFVVDGIKGKIIEEKVGKSINVVDGSKNDTLTTTKSFEKSILVTLPYDSEADLTQITPAITVPTGATVTPATDVVQDFSEGKTVNYTVTAADKKTTTVYTVKVEKMYRLIYEETFGTSFPSMTFTEVATNSKTAFDYVANEGGGFDGITPYQGVVSSNKINIDTVPTKTALSYKRSEAGKEVVGPTETLSPYYVSDGSAPAATDSTEATDIRYVLDKNGDYVLRSSLQAIADPKDAQNTCLRYDKRGGSSTNAKYVRRAIFSDGTSMIYDKEWYGYAQDHAKLTYSIDIYVPDNLKYEGITRFGIGFYNNGASSHSFGVAPNNSNNTLTLYANITDTNVLDRSIVTLENALDKWINLRFEMDYTGTTVVTSVYIDNKYVADLDFVLAANSTNYGKRIGNSSARFIWSIGGSAQSHLGTVLLDNIRIEALY